MRPGEPVDEPARGPEPPLDRDELSGLLDHLFVRTGIDFQRYSQPAIRRRLHHLMLQDGLTSLAALRARLTDRAAVLRLASRLHVKVTSMFRDPPFWRALREQVVPLLRPLPAIRAWLAGCATGEEAYSLAIILREEGLSQRSRIYATDVDEEALEAARAGVYALRDVPEFTVAYVQAGGATAFSEYYTASSAGATLREHLRRSVAFSRHDLAGDTPLEGFHLVLCRNVLIYFEPSLQVRAHELLWRSLAAGGVLGLGRSEVVPQRPRGRYQPLDETQKLYRRPGPGTGGASDSDAPSMRRGPAPRRATQSKITE